MTKKYNKLTKVLGATVVASSLLFPNSAQAAIDSSNISVDAGMENDIVAKINAIRSAYGLPAVSYSPALSEKSRNLLVGAESVESRFSNTAGSAHHYNGVVDYNTNEVWAQGGMSADIAAMNWVTEIYNATPEYPIGHCKAILSASQIGGALATENGKTLYVSSYVDGSPDVAAKAEQVCYNPNLHNNIEGYYAALSGAPVAQPEQPKAEVVQPEQPVEQPKAEIVETEQPVKVEQPSVETPKAEVVQPEQPVKVEQPSTETPKAEVKPEQPSTETPKAEVKPEQPSTETPKAEVKPEQPSAETPKAEVKPEQPSTETPKTEVKPEQPSVEVPKVEVETKQPSTVATNMVKPVSHEVSTTEKQEQQQILNDLTKQAIAEDVAFIDEVIVNLNKLPQTKEVTDLIHQIEKAKNDALAMKDDTKVLEGLENIITAFEKMANEEVTETTSVKEVKSEKATVVEKKVEKASAEATVKKVAKNPNKKMILPNTGVAEEKPYAQMGLFGLLLAALGFGLRRQAK